jgi:cytochrome b6-f complex iron-sulfur subunit
MPDPEKPFNKETMSGYKPCQNCDSPVAKEISREQFIKVALGGLSICWAAMAAYPIYLYLTPKSGANDEKMNVTRVEVCKLSEIPKGTGKNFRFGSVPALLIHNDDGTLHAFKAVCTHLGCTVQYREDKHNIYCACHGGEYDPSTGKNIAGPPPKPLPALSVSVKDGNIIVSKA